MIVIDPLKLKITELLRQGNPQPLKMARVRYGTPKDFRVLAKEIVREASMAPDGIVVDLTPFSRIGDASDFATAVKELRDIPVTIFAIQNAVYESLLKADFGRLCQVGRFDPDGNLIGIDAAKRRHPAAVRLVHDLSACKTLVNFRSGVAQSLLLQLLADGGVVYPTSPSIPDLNRNVVNVDGRHYLRMPNGMLVSSYIDFKRVVARPQALIDVAYEIIYAIYDGFRPELQAPCDVFVVPNNTALLVGAAVQVITDIPVCAIDKLGPIPSLRVNSVHESSLLEEHARVCLLVEVSATGGEIDRTVLHIGTRHVNIVKAISCYHLSVGHSLLTEQIPTTHLCRPKQELGYVYRSH